MSHAQFKTAWDAKDVTPVERLVLLYVAETSGDGWWERNVPALVKWICCSEREAEHALISLRNDHFLESSCGCYRVKVAP